MAAADRVRFCKKCRKAIIGSNNCPDCGNSELIIGSLSELYWSKISESDKEDYIKQYCGDETEETEPVEEREGEEKNETVSSWEIHVEKSIPEKVGMIYLVIAGVIFLAALIAGFVYVGDSFWLTLSFWAGGFIFGMIFIGIYQILNAIKKQ